jgi:SAM-dependent methyltransferase
MENEEKKRITIPDTITENTSNINSALPTLEEHINEIEAELNEIVMNPGSSGYESLTEQDIAYGVSFTVGINPATDTVLDIGCGIGEFYYYVQRFTGALIHKYLGIDYDDNLLEINKFRSNQDDSISLLHLNIDEFQEAYQMYSENALKNLEVLGNINANLDWAVMCNVINDTLDSDEIIKKIKFWSNVPEKGAVFTFRLKDEKMLADVASKVLLDPVLNKKSIIRTDFYPNWISIYVYNSRE